MEGYFVTGGCIASLILGDEPNDIDIYFSDKEFGDYMKKLYTEDPEYMSKVLDIAEKYNGMSSAQDPNAVVPSEPCVTANAITLKNKIQLITRKYGTPEEIRKEFDFVHCMPYYDSRDKKLYISPEQYDCNVNKKLVRNNNNLFQPHREDKFLKRGWTWLTQ